MNGLHSGTLRPCLRTPDRGLDRCRQILERRKERQTLINVRKAFFNFDTRGTDLVGALVKVGVDR